MTQKLLLIAFTFLNATLFSQAEQKAFLDWSENTGTQNFFYKTVASRDKDLSVYIAGATKANNGSTDILISKHNTYGDLVWTQQYNGLANGNDYALGIYVDNTANSYITGIVSNDTSSASLTDLIVIKYDPYGDIIWESTFNGDMKGFDGGRDIIVDENTGYVYVTGGTLNSSYNFDIVVVCFNDNGVYQWSYTYDHNSYDDIGYKISLKKGILISGVVTQSPNNYKLQTIKLDPLDGSIITQATSTAVTTSSVEIVSDVAIDNQNNIYITGSYDVVAQGLNYYTMKLDSDLVTQWTQTYNGSSNLNDFAKGLDVDSLGNVYVTGYSTSSTQGENYVTIKYDSTGTQQWVQTFNNQLNSDDEAFDVVVDDSSNVYVTGYSMSEINNKDYYTIKYNSSGVKIWEIQNDANHLNDMATNIAIDDENNIIVTGQCETSPNLFEYRVNKYIQRDIITPTDFNGEAPASNHLFYPNNGQLIDTNHISVTTIKFLTNNTNPTFYFKDHSQTFVFSKPDTAQTNRKDTLHRIDLLFNDANDIAKTYPMEQQDKAYLNFFLPHTGDAKTKGIFGNKRLITPNIYNNIDLMCSSNLHGIKYYFIIKPGGEIRDIQMEFIGASSFSLNSSTNALSINSNIGSITFDKPVAYQLTTGNSTVAVTSFSPTWTSNGASNKFKFNHGTYTSSLTLVIEVDEGNAIYSPTSSGNIKWSTYLGGSSSDMNNKVKTNNLHEIFVVGQSLSTVFPQNSGVSTIFQTANAGAMDGVISKFSPVGELMWSTYVGGDKHDNLVDIAFHPSGDLYFVGNTNSSNLPYVNKSGADNDDSYAGATAIGNTTELYWTPKEAFIFQLSSDAQTNKWLRYYGGSEFDGLTACAFDNNKNFFITGFSNSPDISNVTPTGSYAQTNPSVSPFNNSCDGIIARFNTSSVITWATYIGSKTSVGNAPDDRLMDIVIADGSDGGPQDFYVCGHASGTDYPIVYTGSESHYSSNEDDAVVTRFTNTGAIVWSTYLSGTGSDLAKAIAYNNGLYVTGHTSSSDFLTIDSGNEYYDGSYGTGGSDAFFTKVNINNIITHSTFIGGSNNEYGHDIAIDYTNDVAYISGESNGSDFPIPTNNPTNTYNQSYSGSGTTPFDNFICALKDNQTSMLWGTYLGGSLNECNSGKSNDDLHQSICIDGSNFYLVGLTKTNETQTLPFPLDNNGGAPTYFQSSLNGLMDATLTKFDLVPVNVVGVKELTLANDAISIYPNPTSSNLFIKLNVKIEKASYKIVNSLGQIVSEGQLKANLNSISTERLSSGFYVIEISDNKSIFSNKFVKHD
ncbi:MAG: SBBP repeat-containing protein [Bacteroidota bacterium]